LARVLSAALLIGLGAPLWSQAVALASIARTPARYGACKGGWCGKSLRRRYVD